MKKLPSILLATFILILITVSCDDDPVTAKDKIVGNWLWLQSTGDWTGGTITPNSVGYSIIVSFEEDGTYSRLQSDSLVHHGSYTVKRREVRGADRDILIIKGEYTPRCPEDQIVEFENANKLKLTEIYMDWYEHTYIRIGHPLD